MKYDNIRRGLNIASPMASVLSLLNPAFLAIPIISSVANELFSYFDNKNMEKRLHGLQDELEKKQISIDDFANHISRLEEHSQYVVRNNVKHLCLSAQPETTDALNKAIIDLIMNEPYGLPEYACEILQQCNSSDIILLKLIKNFLINGRKEQYHTEELKQAQSKTRAEPSDILTAFEDRNVSYGENTTIYWEDFAHMLHLDAEKYDLVTLLSVHFQAELGGDQFETDYFSCLARSIIKMQNLGVLQCEYYTTLRTISSGNIDCFHISLFGKKLLEYIELDEGQDKEM